MVNLVLNALHESETWMREGEVLIPNFSGHVVVEEMDRHLISSPLELNNLKSSATCYAKHISHPRWRIIRDQSHNLFWVVHGGFICIPFHLFKYSMKSSLRFIFSPCKLWRKILEKFLYITNCEFVSEWTDVSNHRQHEFTWKTRKGKKNQRRENTLKCTGIIMNLAEWCCDYKF